MIDRLNQKSEVTALSHAVENKMPDVPEVEIYEDITDIGRDITVRDVSEEAEPGKIPIRSEDNVVEYREIRLINPNFPLPHGMRMRSIRRTGIITSGNSHIDIDMFSSEPHWGISILGAQVKCLAIAGIAPSYWNACYYFNSVNVQDIADDLLDYINIGDQSSFDVNAASNVITSYGGFKYVRIYLDVPAVQDAEYDVVLYIQDFIGCETAS